MRLEMEGKEPLIVLFGVPLVTTVIVISAVHYGQANTRIVPPPPITVEAPRVTPRVTAEIPQGTIHVTNEVPPAQIHEVVREVVRVPDVHVTNQVEPAKSPEVHVTLPPGAMKGGDTTVLAIPTPVPMISPKNVSNDDAPHKNGKLLPPPKTGETPTAR